MATKPGVEARARRLGTVAEACAYGRISKNTVYRLIASGAVRAYQAGRILRIDLDSVDEWLKPVRTVRDL